jgi:hypothetical protein
MVLMSVNGAGLGRLGAVVVAMGAALALAACGMPADNSPAGQKFNEQFAKSTHDSCVPSAQQHGATADQAEKYCTCVVAQLAPLSIQEKMSLPLNQDKMKTAAAACASSMQ